MERGGCKAPTTSPNQYTGHVVGQLLLPVMRKENIRPMRK